MFWTDLDIKGKPWVNKPLRYRLVKNSCNEMAVAVVIKRSVGWVGTILGPNNEVKDVVVGDDLEVVKSVTLAHVRME